MTEDSSKHYVYILSHIKTQEGIRQIVTDVMHNLPVDPEFKSSADAESMQGLNYVKVLLPAGSKWFIPQGVPSWFTKEDAGGNVLAHVDSIFNAYKATNTWNSMTNSWQQNSQQLLGDVERFDELTQWWRNQAGIDNPLTVGITFTEAYTASLSQRFSDTGIVTQLPAQTAGTTWYLNVAVSTLQDQGNITGLQRLANSVLDDFMIVQEY